MPSVTLPWTFDGDFGAVNLTLVVLWNDYDAGSRDCPPSGGLESAEIYLHPGRSHEPGARVTPLLTPLDGLSLGERAAILATVAEQLHHRDDLARDASQRERCEP